MVSEMETQKEEKFQIDLMVSTVTSQDHSISFAEMVVFDLILWFPFQAPPPQVRSSPERETKIDLTAAAMDQKPVSSSVEAVCRSMNSKNLCLQVFCVADELYVDFFFLWLSCAGFEASGVER